MKILLLVEGQTEEVFVKELLGPYFFKSYNLQLIPKLLTTKIVKDGPNFKGGVPKYSKVKKEIKRLLGDSNAIFVSTMIDYYALPDSFPGKNDNDGTNAQQRVEYLERKLNEDINDDRFIPYYSLHEYETLLYSSPTQIAKTLVMPEIEKDLDGIINSFQNLEEINDGVYTSPSRRILRLCPTYDKVLHGPLIARRIGLDEMKAKCQHFNLWIETLEARVRSHLNLN